jgi:hypothetical protein
VAVLRHDVPFTGGCMCSFFFFFSVVFLFLIVRNLFPLGTAPIFFETQRLVIYSSVRACSQTRVRTPRNGSAAAKPIRKSLEYSPPEPQTSTTSTNVSSLVSLLRSGTA